MRAIEYGNLNKAKAAVDAFIAEQNRQGQTAELSVCGAPAGRALPVE
jgi:hypothetical protein